MASSSREASRGDLADGNADARVGEVTVQFGRHIKVHKVAIAQLALERRNAMGRFIIDADTRRSWKSIGDTGCGASPVASEYLSPHGVEFARGCARSDGLHHGPAGLGDDATGTKQCIEVFLLVDRHARECTPDHDAILFPAAGQDKRLSVVTPRS